MDFGGIVTAARWLARLIQPRRKPSAHPPAPGAKGQQ